ncbi:Major Facilitator Superfamily protein [Prosthecobacter debontii]|uniref:Major Facilitator Superfamily protein n=1 Tax=Prosthecobacter debontii TaxID=48467 RepID=A0A1T4WIX2_9BACT|nr:MFS transporter [Prosthecobacter debontii]SKA76848.1 Major Facilitator Superfamily protein [Prosthecobacter debontii]
MKSAPPSSSQPDMKLFWACFIALVATSFVFGVRANTIGELQSSFNLSESQKGDINGAGMWPFALSIIFFSFIIDRIGYKTVALFAIVCHVVSLVLTLRASGFKDFYWSTLLVAVANGTVESFINPVVATLFNKNKSKWLNILHAGWPAGLALGALFCALLPDTKLFFGAVWQFRFALCFIPVVLYALLILPRTFPVNERVAAGVSYRDMLKEVGAVGFFIIGSLVYFAVMQMAGHQASLMSSLIVGTVIAVLAGLYTGSLGNWLFLVVLITIGPLATTELGTDGWMPDLLKLSGPNFPHFETWIFVYVSTIMTVLRFYAGPIVHRFSPIGLLVIGAMIAITGLLMLSHSIGWAILGASTVYALGKTFLWSTTLGLTSEQFPKGGALTLNGVSAVGVLFLGVLGSPYIGYKQDMDMDKRLNVTEHTALYTLVQGQPKEGIFGTVPTLDQTKIQSLLEDEKKTLEAVQAESKRSVFTSIAVLPTFMLICYIGLFIYFRSKGGYKPVEIGAH